MQEYKMRRGGGQGAFIPFGSALALLVATA